MHDTDAFEYLGKSYQIPAVKLKAGKVKDAEGSGIKKYSFGSSKDNGTTWTWEGETEVGENVQEIENVEYIITGLVEGEKCLVKMQVEDRAGNKQESQTMEVTYLTGVELKDASNDVKKAYQFTASIHPNTPFTVACSVGEIAYCTDTYVGQYKIGYYRTLQAKTAEEAHYGLPKFNDTDFWEFIGENFVIPYGMIKVNTIN